MLNNEIGMHNITINSTNPVFFIEVLFFPNLFPLSSHAEKTTYKELSEYTPIKKPTTLLKNKHYLNLNTKIYTDHYMAFHPFTNG